jgi:hypothetical protein
MVIYQLQNGRQGNRSWDQVRRIPNYLGIMGEMIFIRKIDRRWTI